MLNPIASKKNIVIFGCGDIGARISRALPSDEYSVFGIRRSKPSDKESALPIHWRQADILDADALNSSLPDTIDIAVVTLTPGERSDRGYQQAYVDTAKKLCQQLKKQPPKLLLFVSSTGVYAQNNGESVTEESEVKPVTFTGKRLLEAENIYQQSNIPTCCIRFSGIYGPGRHTLLRNIYNHSASRSTAISNRIHVDDCAGVICHLIKRSQENKPLQSLYLGSDTEPSEASTLHPWLCQQLKIAPVTIAATPIAGRYCRSHRLIDSSYQFLYPSFREGYPDIISDFLERQALA